MYGPHAIAFVGLELAAFVYVAKEGRVHDTTGWVLELIESGMNRTAMRCECILRVFQVLAEVQIAAAQPSREPSLQH